MTATLDDLNVPGPTVTTQTKPFWDAAAEGRLLIQRCAVCDAAIFYPRAQCPHCWSRNLAWEEASGVGVLKSFSCVVKPGHPAWQPIAPYTVGLVALAEGPTMLSLILHDETRQPAIGAALRFAPTRVGKRMLPLFRAAGAGLLRDGVQ